jgi:hypothetical protein
VTQTAAFSPEALLAAFDYAESRFDVCLYPMPDLDIAWRNPGPNRPGLSPDVRVILDDHPYITKLIMSAPRELSEIRRLAEALTHPYQIHFGPDIRDHDYIASVLECVSGPNPYTPFEVVFIEPARWPSSSQLLSHVKLSRPHYLDLDLRYLFPRPGNRAVLFTVVTGHRRRQFKGEMERRVYWWRHRRLPTRKDLHAHSEFDGVLIDAAAEADVLTAWQDRFAGEAGEFLHIGFADIALQRRWFDLTAADAYYANAWGG